jgi:hypothetical protein
LKVQGRRGKLGPQQLIAVSEERRRSIQAAVRERWSATMGSAAEMHI